jgi:hypothetical protein
VSAYGLSAAVVSQANKIWFTGQDVSAFLYFLTIFAGALPLLGFIFVRLSTESPTTVNPARVRSFHSISTMPLVTLLLLFFFFLLVRVE